VDLGDHVGVTGEVITSRSGELSVLASSWTLTAKSPRQLPEKFRGLTDAESRVRQRYVDLIVNPGARRSAELRAADGCGPVQLRSGRCSVSAVWRPAGRGTRVRLHAGKPAITLSWDITWRRR
jgi:hypothetical protein